MNKTSAKKIILLLCLFSTLQTMAQDTGNALAATPPMGWNSWNFFEEKIDETILKQTADAMAQNGMLAAGYNYIVIDDHWVGGRDRKNKLFPDPVRFPGGMRALADYVHSRGLKLGIYSDAATLTCGGVTGSYGFEELDAKTFAEWGIDYLKYDYCNAPDDVTTAFSRYKKMGDALKNSGRPIVYSICEWGQRKPWLWARAAGGQLWRTTWDSRDVWQSHDKDLTGVMEIFDQQDGLQQYAGPGGWNDPDLLMVGLYGKGSSSSVDGRFKGCNTTEYRSHFALWCVLAAPLMVNSDLRNIEPVTLALLTNRDLIAIDQDGLGRQGHIVYKKDSIEVLAKELDKGEIALCVLNRSAQPVTLSIDVPGQLGIRAPFGRIKDIFGGAATKYNGRIKCSLDVHDTRVYRLSL